MGTNPSAQRQVYAKRLRRLRHRLQHLDKSASSYPRQREALLRDIQLAQAQWQRASRTGSRRPAKAATRPKSAAPARKAQARPGNRAPSTREIAGRTPGRRNLANLLSPQGIQQTLKSVTNLRSMVKNWLGYLQQADQLLDTLHSTTHSLRETGVLDKLIKHKGRNLTTDDYTNILIALMNSPLGNQLLKSAGGGNQDTTPPAAPSPAPNPAPAPGPMGGPGLQQPN